MRKNKTDWVLVKIWIAILIVLGAICLSLMSSDDAKADGTELSRDGWEGVVQLRVDIACDSGWAIFKFGTLARDTVHLYPTRSIGTTYDSTYLSGSGLSLDSIGSYGVQQVFWPKGSGFAKFDTGAWYHEGPGRITAASPSGSYVCRVYGYLSDLSSAYVKNAVVTYKLDKQMVYDTCSKMVVFKRDGSCAPTGTNGYYEFDVVRSYCIKGQKYTVTVSKPGLVPVTKTIEVPDSSTYYMTWGN